MNDWGLFALVMFAVPVAAVVVWFGKDYLSARRRRLFIARYQPETSVAAIQARIAREREDEQQAAAETAILPKIPADEPVTDVLPVTLQPRRKRRYVNNPPSPYPRKKFPAPDHELMQRILDGLKRLE